MLDMKVHRINHVGFVVNDRLTAKALFLNLGLELQGEGSLKGARKARRCMICVRDRPTAADSDKARLAIFGQDRSAPFISLNTS